jgi:hypothetical protein
VGAVAAVAAVVAVAAASPNLPVLRASRNRRAVPVSQKIRRSFLATPMGHVQMDILMWATVPETLSIVDV